MNEDEEIQIMKADGLDEAILGTCAMTGRIIYSVDKCIDILVTRDGMSPEEAQEFFEFNTLGAYMGEGTPIFMREGFLED